MDDFLIIGGGIAGLSAGAALAPLGRVTVWEAEDATGYHASGRSAALFEQAYGAPEVVALNRASHAAHAAAGHLSPRGLMLIGLRGEEEVFAADLAGMGLAEIGPDEARATVPILSEAVTRAARDSAASDLDTHAMLEDAKRAIRAAGGTVETGRRVDAIERVKGGWSARAGEAEGRARVIVNAAGAWADGLAALAGVAPLGLMPLRRSMARLAAPGGHDVTGWPMLLGAGERWYAKPDAGALLVSPADEDPSDAMDAWADDMVLAEGLDRWQAASTAPVTRPLSTWAGLRTFAPDRLPVIGPGKDAGWFWCAGQGGYGFQTAPAASRLLACRVAGRMPELDGRVVAALDPARLEA